MRLIELKNQIGELIILHGNAETNISIDDGMGTAEIAGFGFQDEIVSIQAGTIQPKPFEHSEGVYQCPTCSDYFQAKGRICTALMMGDCDCPRCQGLCTCREGE